MSLLVAQDVPQVIHRGDCVGDGEGSFGRLIVGCIADVRRRMSSGLA
jgi:hypothetical protein